MWELPGSFSELDWKREKEKGKKMDKWSKGQKEGKTGRQGEQEKQWKTSKRAGGIGSSRQIEIIFLDESWS